MDVRKLAQFIYEATGEARFKADGTYWLDWNELNDDKQIEWIAVARLVLDKMVDDGEKTPLPELLGFMSEDTVREAEKFIAAHLEPDYGGTLKDQPVTALRKIVNDHVEMLKEIADYGTILGHCSEIYYHVTNGTISKPFTLPEVVKAMHDDITTEEFKQWMEDELEYCAVLSADEAIAIHNNHFDRHADSDDLTNAIAKCRVVRDAVERDSVKDNG